MRDRQKNPHKAREVLSLALLVWIVCMGFLPAMAVTPDNAMARGKNGMVVSADAVASRVGLEILRRGGNAVDAAVAVGFALAVTWPRAGNIGGGGFMLIRKSNGEAMIIDYRETAPARANRDMYLDPQGKARVNVSRTGHLAAGVPGTVAGFARALAAQGTMKWAEVVEPARKLAEEGFPVNEVLTVGLVRASERLGQFPESRRVFLREGQPYKAGEKFLQPDLADTLERIQEKGPREFYEGRTAELLVETMKEGDGLISLEDLRSYRAVDRVPLCGSYRGYEILSMPPPSSGGGILLEMLNMLEGFDVKGMAAGTPQCSHLLIEVMRRAFRDRAQYYGDSDFVKIPLDPLISKEYATRLAAQIDLRRATPSSALPGGNRLFPESRETTHYTVADRWGNVVSNTYTLNGGYGCAVTVKGAGFLLNNEMDDFSTQAGEPNAYGLVHSEANAIQPRKRPLSCMTPTVVTRQGKFFLALGSQGGPTIISQVLQVLINLIDHGMPLDEAIRAPRLHHQYLPDVVEHDQEGFDSRFIQALEAMGHQLKVDPGFPRIGDVEAVLLDSRTGLYLGMADPRNLNARAVGF